MSTGGGMGKYLADWIIDGEPPSELFDTDANRYDLIYENLLSYFSRLSVFCFRFFFVFQSKMID